MAKFRGGKIMKKEPETAQMKEKITLHINRLIEKGSQAIKLQFKRSSEDYQALFSNNDPLGEESRYSPVKGIVHKFKNRILWKVSYRCAAHCQFCTRIRQIGTADGDLEEEDINTGLGYIAKHSEVDDVILSGGDPFYTPQTTIRIIDGLSKIQSVKVIRIGTRLPVHAPESLETPLQKALLKKLSDIAKKQPLFILLHIEHTDELTLETIKAINLLKRTGAILLSQTVFLKNINDDKDILEKLFVSLYHLGVMPYYIYRCDYVQGLERFVCSIEKEQHIMTELRRRLSGIAIPTYIVDVPGVGKIPVPLAFWKGIDLSECTDFNDKTIVIKETKLT